MPVVGIGTDIVEINRFRKFLAQEKTVLLNRLFTPEERSYAMKKQDPGPHFAARFAAKEACLKAFGLGLRHGLSWQDISVVQDQYGKPDLNLAGRAAEIAERRLVNTIHLSYSHDGDYAVAMVVLECR
ncbi:MAG: holo-ACP synthase [Deltaproteobacteria bacterium]|nr:holo-ACP synthase [Deltaproteobacteria bacterium]MBW2520521.1 holo-ACP synthase [Deltaproteobacteria bacterium]